MGTKLSHLDSNDQPQMVNIAEKAVTERSAEARAVVCFPPDAAVLLGLDQAPSLSTPELRVPKGPVFQTAIIAGIMAAKKTHELIPLCHPLSLDQVTVDIQALGKGIVEIRSTCRTTHRTGVEMEALTAASIAALTIYDMCKAISHQIEIRELMLVTKSGGRSDYERS